MASNTLKATKLVKNQVKKYGPKKYKEDGTTYTITVNVRYDDQCGNGQNSFGITADVYEGRRESSFGCQHELVIKNFPELKPFIKWHLTSSDEPMHYLANSLYHAKENRLDAARSCAVWPEATDEQLRDKNLENVLKARLPSLMIEFQEAMETLGFNY